MSDPMKQSSEDERLSTLDKINLAFGVLAILLLSASLAMSYVPAPSVKWPAELPNWLRTGGMGAMVLYVITLALLKEKEIGAFLKHRHTHSGANIALQIAGVPTALVKVPEASHGGIAGRPSQSAAKAAAILAWFDKYRVPSGN